MKKNVTILIADRNPHVRKLLQREMTATGFRVRLAENGRQVLKMAFQGDALDLVILDTDLPDADEFPILKRLTERIPPLPIIMHGYNYDVDTDLASQTDIVFVEKGSESVEHLKKIVRKHILM